MKKDTSRLMEIMCAAVDMKEKMKTFYEEAAATCSDEVGASVFRILHEMEGGQLGRIREVYADLAKGKADFDSCRLYDFTTPDRKAIKQRIAREKKALSKACLSDVAALESGMELEDKSIEYFTDRLKQATDAAEREFLNHMIADEREHFIMLADLKFYYVDPGHWFMEKGRTDLDGAGLVT